MKQRDYLFSQPKIDTVKHIFTFLTFSFVFVIGIMLNSEGTTRYRDVFNWSFCFKFYWKVIANLLFDENFWIFSNNLKFSCRVGKSADNLAVVSWRLLMQLRILMITSYKSLGFWYNPYLPIASIWLFVILSCCPNITAIGWIGKPNNFSHF